jgi:drug/metabolite transporter (DMT)-like permease
VAALYVGLARGSAAVISPTATVIGASLPVLLSGLRSGLPRLTEAAGILLGLAGIWLVSRPSGAAGLARRGSLLLALVAGAGFGGYFILIAEIDPGPVFLPLSVAKLAALLFAGVALLAGGQALPSPRSSPLSLLTGLLDGSGNLFYLLAAQRSGIAVGAVLSSMAPAATVLLSVWLLREQLRRAQAAGVLLCLAGAGLISL